MSHNRNRPKTNSLTHLTKIIAEEVFEEKIEKHFTRSDFNDVDKQLEELVAIAGNAEDEIDLLISRIKKVEKQLLQPHFQDIDKQLIYLTDTVKKLNKKWLNSEDTLQYLKEKVEKMPDVTITNLKIDTKEAIKKVNNDLLKFYELWSDDEHELLERELNIAITAIAANHQRCVESIQSRIQKIAKKGKFFR